MKLTAKDMKENKLIDGIIPEPLGGAHRDKAAAFKNVKEYVLKAFNELKDLSTTDLVAKRMDKYCDMGEFKE